jgi:peptide/nickel transport system permease protein
MKSAKASILAQVERSKNFWRLYRRNKLALAASFILAAIICMGLLAPLAPYGPFELVGEPLLPPGQEHLIGTDELGRDILSQVLYGCRTSICIAVIATLFSAILSTLIGSIAGYFGGLIDDILMRITDFFMVLPRFVLAVVMAALLGASLWNIIFVVAVLEWPRATRLLRSQILYLREEQFVEAARALGSGSLSIIFREIFPNALFILIIDSSLTLGHAILLESGLSFLGLSDPTVMSLGYILNRAMATIRVAWHPVFFPGLFIFLIVFCSNVIGDWLNDIYNPRIRGRK